MKVCAPLKLRSEEIFILEVFLLCVAGAIGNNLFLFRLGLVLRDIQISDQVDTVLSDCLGIVESDVFRRACIIFYEKKQSSIPTLKTRNFFFAFVVRKQKQRIRMMVPV
ncbi:hypothetical protein [Leptospira noguchii]|uniref:hypothetical protein n=1 Tax=Leptospira noguchii TaxID=28182 RepID=UPI001E3C749C|nr:hypothetical protein [Leptospira noguchii]